MICSIAGREKRQNNYSFYATDTWKGCQKSEGRDGCALGYFAPDTGKGETAI